MFSGVLVSCKAILFFFVTKIFRLLVDMIFSRWQLKNGERERELKKKTCEKMRTHVDSVTCGSCTMGESYGYLETCQKFSCAMVVLGHIRGYTTLCYRVYYMPVLQSV